MGVKGMKDFLKAVCPDVLLSRVDPSSFVQTFKNKRMAWDAHFFVHTIFKSGAVTPDDLAVCVDTMLARYSDAGATGFFVLDGTNVLPLKTEIAHVERRAAAASTRTKLEESKVALETASVAYSTMATPAAAAEHAEAKEKHDKLVIYASRPKKEHYDVACEVAARHGFIPVKAPDEGERMCAYMAKTGEVDFCVTDDWDALPFGAPMTLRWAKSGSPMLVSLDEVLRLSNMSYETFVDACILLGGDYSIRMFGVGPKKIVSVLKSEDEAPSTKRIEDVLADLLAGKSRKPRVAPPYGTARTYFTHDIPGVSNSVVRLFDEPVGEPV